MAKLDCVKTLDMVNGEITKVAYDGAEYERVEGPAQTGDLVLPITDGFRDATKGSFYKAIDVDRDGDAVILDDVGDRDGSFRHNYDLFRKVSASHPSLEDRVSTNEKDIESLKFDVATLKGEAEPKYIRIARSEARAGDYVKFIETYDDDITMEKMYEIDQVDWLGDIYFTDDVGDENYASADDTYAVYRKVSAASAEAEPKPERLKVGDYAKVVREEFGHLFDTDDIIELIEAGNNPNFKARRLSDGEVWFVDASELVRATDEEVAEAKRKQAKEEERKRWAAIGREVGEYKVGDVVAYDAQRWFRNSGIGEVIGFGATGNPEVEAIDYEGHRMSYFLKSEHLNLVTPVESRFDRKGDE
ncbi:hypothetical protein [Bacillus licheniformis]|uniref:hypothetical protein n=1 Tax=Bacillus licheniformis TaxID=1402 RepID=UPI0009B74922|nr:hypothetical protein [Bacillus licheniformis]ARC72409.1 hypothetical protein B37_00354 [Bacillus licheniformis]ARW41544.1 hypothetical protein S100141_00219 [Bacillus licheniformis]ARW53019.1 hypothetical protein S100027_01020 [Bacillus licheniformis]AXF87679.1 hypothetical protein BLDA23_05060 [Bacillus licheniformis]